MIQRKNPRLVAVAALLSLGIPLISGCQNASATVEAKEPPALSVKTTDVTMLETPRRLRLTGTLRGAKETDLAANVTGQVLTTTVERGQSVKAGEVVAKIDTRAAQLALKEAKVSVASSEVQQQINQAECQRYENLREAQVISALEYDQVMAKCKTSPFNLEAARARQSIAAKNVGDGLIRAPFAGVVIERQVEVGEHVQPASRVLSLASVDELRVVFSVVEKHFADVKQGAQVLVSVAAYGDETFPGKVAHISGAVRETRDVVVEAIVPNKDRRLLPGMFAELQLSIGSEKLPSVPEAAVFAQNGKSNVFLAKQGQLEQRVVSVAEQIGDRLVLRGGLTRDDKVVSVLSPELKNGTRIK